MTDSNSSTEVATFADGSALMSAVADKVNEVIALPAAQRDAWLSEHALTASDASVVDANRSPVDTIAAAQVLAALGEVAQGIGTYQRALNFRWAESVKMWGTPTSPFKGQGSYVRDALGLSEGYGTTLKSLAHAAVDLGIDGGSQTWRHLVQSNDSRKMIGTEGKASKAILSRLDKAVKANPTGKAQPASGTRGGSRKSNKAGGTDTKVSPVDAARDTVNASVKAIRDAMPALSVEGRKGAVVAVEALLRDLKGTGAAPVSGSDRSGRTGKATK